MGEGAPELCGGETSGQRENHFGFHYSVTFGFEALPAASILALNITFDISLEETALTVLEKWNKMSFES